MEKFKKIDDDLYGAIIEKKDSIKDYLCNNVESFYTGILEDFKENLDSSLFMCESPIEQMLSLEFERIGIVNMMLFNPNIDIVDVDKQGELEIDGKTYRADFVIPVIYKQKTGDDKYQLFIVECDGHEFHQKTKEQVERDNIRTRAFQKAGYMVIRFSGREINKNPRKCVKEIINIILAKSEV